MIPALAGSVELLERALGHTRVSLASVDHDLLGRATPCREWHLDRLLGHMDDALDAFLEASRGSVRVTVPPVVGRVPVTVLRDKACALLGAWTQASTRDRVDAEVDIGGVSAPGSLLVASAALEITVHGWDVDQATGADHPLPDALAQALLPVAHDLVTAADRPTRFAPARPVAEHAGAAERLLAHLGRAPGDR